MTKGLLRDPSAYEAVQWFADLIVKHQVAPMPTDDRSGFTFPSGKVAMSHNEGSWMISEFMQIRKNNPEFDWDYALFPKGPAGVNTLVLNAGGFGLATQSKFKEETWKFLNYMTRGGAEYLSKFGDGAYLPTRYSSIEKPGLYYHDNPGYNQKAVVDGITQGIPPKLKHPNEMEIWRAISTSLVPVWLGTKSAKEACIEASDMIDFLLNG